MKALLLAAGRSKRVKPIEDKNFLRFCGKYLIEHQLEALKKAGFNEITIVGGAHNLERLTEVAKNFSAHMVEQKDLDQGMAGAVLSAESHIQDGPLLIMSSNDVVEDSVFELLKKALQGDGDAFLLAYRVKKYFPGGYLKVNGLQIESIVEKPLPGEEPSDLINLVYHIHRDPKALFAALKKVSNEKDDRYELALDALMREKTFKAIP
ncbi:MAG: NDP-sugar synthase, partial [Patescibacteria group bacterium]